MKFLTAFVIGLALIGGGQARASLVWYNGDPNGGTTTNENNGSIDARVYDDFTVTATTTITDVFSNNYMNFVTSTAEWEIRTGLASGSGGSIFASGTGAATQNPNGFNTGVYTGYTIDVGGLNVILSPGVTYWLMVAPVGAGSGASFVATTSKANSVGNPTSLDGNSYFDSPTFAATFSPQGLDYSMGVASTPLSAATPEPGSLALAACGIVGMFAGAYRRARQRRA